MRNFLAPIAKGRHQNANHREPVVQVLAKFSFEHALLEVCVGRRNHAHVDALRPRFAERHNLALLEKPQKLGLHVHRQIADLVQEQRGANRRAHESKLVVHRAGKTAAAMAEQLAVGQFARCRRAVVWEEHRRAAQRSYMDGPRDQLFARAAFSCNQHGEVVALQPLDLFHDPHHRRTGAQKPRQ